MSTASRRRRASRRLIVAGALIATLALVAFAFARGIASPGQPAADANAVSQSSANGV
jgi:hypothetical protein